MTNDSGWKSGRVGDVRSYVADEVLRDGESIRIRAVRSDDRERILEHFDRLSPQSVYFRYFRAKTRLTDEEIRQHTEPDFDRDVSLAAVRRDRDGEHVVGLARYKVVENEDGAESRRAEIAFSVADEHQGRGIGALLLDRLTDIARSRGIEEFEADILGENNRMLRVLAKSGFAVTKSVDHGVFHLQLPTQETDTHWQASSAREATAAAQSVRAFFRPRSVAVIGASRDPRKVGAAILHNIREGGFAGEVAAINAAAAAQGAEIAGLRAYASLAAAGEAGVKPELAIIAAPAAGVEQALVDCAAAGVRAAIVISRGFGEASEEGRLAEQRLRQVARQAGMRLIGPNCMGVLNADPAAALNATPARRTPASGTIGMLSQGGALGLGILDYMRGLNLGISSFVSIGNRADVSSNDLLAYWSDDAATNVVLLYLESVGNPRKFAYLARETARRKPVLAIKSRLGAHRTQRAGAEPGEFTVNAEAAVDALFAQAGVLRSATLEEMFDAATLLSTQPLLQGNRIGVVTNSDGPAVLFADACRSRGLELPALEVRTRAMMRNCAGLEAGASAFDSAIGNPLILGPEASPEIYASAIGAMGSDANVDAVMVFYTPLFSPDTEGTARAIAEAAARLPLSKPIATVFQGERGVPAILSTGARGPIPAFLFPENAAMAFGAAWQRRRWVARPAGEVFSLDRVARQAVRAIVEKTLGEAGASGPGGADTAGKSAWVDPMDMAAILRAAGIGFPEFEVVRIEEAAATAERLGYPLVAKAHAPHFRKRSRHGGVVMGLRSAQDVADAAEFIRTNMRGAGVELERVILQRMAPEGIEGSAGVTMDETFGPVVVCALEGLMVELIDDVAFRLPPVSDRDAEEMIDGLRARPLLDGRGSRPAGDRAALVDVLRRISALVEVVPEMEELSLDPIKILSPGKGAMALHSRMRLGRG